MADRSIYCTGCKRYLGVIHKAKLRKNIHHLCDNCNIKRIASDIGKEFKPDDFDFRDMFKGFQP